MCIPLRKALTCKSNEHIALLQSLGQAALISTGSSYMALCIPPFIVGVYILQTIYLRTSRQLRFLDLEAKSPLFSNFVETFEGVVTIRAFGWQEKSRAVNWHFLDASQQPYYLLLCVQRWLNLVLDLMIAGMAIVVITLSMQLRSSSSGALLGIALNNVLGFNQSLTMMITEWTKLETSLGAIARLKTFEAETPSESRPGEDTLPPDSWPQFGSIEFRSVSASYG